MNDQRDNVLQHMRKLWNNWRGSLHKNVKSKSLHEVLKDVPMGVDKSDWEWLVKEHFLSDKFKVWLHSYWLISFYFQVTYDYCFGIVLLIKWFHLWSRGYKVVTKVNLRIKIESLNKLVIISACVVNAEIKYKKHNQQV